MSSRVVLVSLPPTTHSSPQYFVKHSNMTSRLSLQEDGPYTGTEQRLVSHSPQLLSSRFGSATLTLSNLVQVLAIDIGKSRVQSFFYLLVRSHFCTTGTTASACTLVHLMPGQIPVPRAVQSWPASPQESKVPSLVLYDNSGRARAFCAEAKELLHEHDAFELVDMVRSCGEPS